MQIREVFEQECSDLKVDHTLFKKIVIMESDFVNKHPDHISFFGGTLTGVHVVRFTPDDREKLFSDILKTDETYLESKLYSLKDSRGGLIVNPEFKVSSDIFSLSCVYLIHAIDNSRYLSDKEKDEGKVRVCTYMLYRFLTSRLFRHFPYPADESIAKATYEILSGKYLLKQQGSWAKTLRYIAEKAVSSDGIHASVIKKMDVDTGVINMLNDVQGRIRDMLKNIYNEFTKVHAQGTKITKNSSFIETDGEMVLKDKHKSLANYTRYLNSIISDKNSFIKQELIDVVSDMMHTMPERLLVQSLEWCSSNYGHLKDKLIEQAIDAVMEHAFDYLSDNKALLHNKADIATLISKLRGAYMSSRSTDDKIILSRELCEKIVINATRTKNDSVVSSTRTGLMIYFVLRSITMKHYVG
jgi:hypothetical protein